MRGSGFTIKGADSGGSTFTGSGVFVNNWSSDVKVDNNILTDNDFGVGTANAFLSTGPTEITGNFILNNRFHGISGAGGTLIANNIIAFNDFSGISNGGTSSAYSVINNTIIGNKQEGINTWDDRVSTTMNNIVSDNGGFGINVRTANNPTAKRPIVTANLFFTNADRNFSDIDAPVGSDATLNSAAEINSISEDGTSEFDIGADEFEPPPKCNGLRPTIIGTEGDDILIGSSRADVIRGLGVNDVIKGKGGDDTICAGPGEDAVSGGLGDDWISGEAGPDSINGGAPAKTR